MPFATKEKRLAWYAKTKEARKAARNRFSAKHPQYHCRRVTSTYENYITQLWYFAKNRDKDCTLTKQYLLDMYAAQSGKCAVTRVPMTHRREKGKKILTNISIDRVDNARGYAEGNVRLVCVAVNAMKSNMTNHDFVQWCCAVAKFNH